MLTAIIALTVICMIIGSVLGFVAVKFKVKGDPLVDKINSILPQTQCGQCNYPGCKPYAKAIAAGDDINKCPPGGQETIDSLADLLGVESKNLDASKKQQDEPLVALIREDECIGCTKCIQYCPVDAIIGSAKHMHTVIIDECTGCKLCVAPCPVDCIDIIKEPDD